MTIYGCSRKITFKMKKKPHVFRDYPGHKKRHYLLFTLYRICSAYIPFQWGFRNVKNVYLIISSSISTFNDSSVTGRTSLFFHNQFFFLYYSIRTFIILLYRLSGRTKKKELNVKIELKIMIIRKLEFNKKNNKYILSYIYINYPILLICKSY